MYVITLGVIRSRVGSFIPGKCSKIWGAAISLGHVYINVICAIFHTFWVNVHVRRNHRCTDVLYVSAVSFM